MKVRTRLILAFLLLAVIPLTFVSLYSYRSSLAAFRQATEAESGALADDIGVRMESVRAELGRRIERLGNFPFRNFMAQARRPDAGLSQRLMTEIGDAASMVEGLEFTPAPPPPPRHRRPAPSYNCREWETPRVNQADRRETTSSSASRSCTDPHRHRSRTSARPRRRPRRCASHCKP
jgi:hypothetical protein